MESETEMERILGQGTAQDICAFANTGGGTMIIGRNDNGETVGARGPQELLKTIRIR